MQLISVQINSQLTSTDTTGFLFLCLSFFGRPTLPQQKVNTAFCPSEGASIFTVQYPRSVRRASPEDLITLEIQVCLSILSVY